MIGKMYVGLDEITKLYIGNELMWSSVFSPLDLFKNSEQGIWFDPSDLTTMFKDATGTQPVAANGDPVGLIKDKSGNANHAAQTISAARMNYVNAAPPSLYLDKVDDFIPINVPAGGWVGTMVVATGSGTASYGFSLKAGALRFGRLSFPSNNLNGLMIRNGRMTESEKNSAERYYSDKGFVASFVNTTELNAAWAYWDYLTDFPFINISKAQSFSYSWFSCTLLTNFPSNMFDSCKTSDFESAFSGTNLTQVSIDGILTSLVTSGMASGRLRFNQSGGSAPSAIGNAAIDTLRLRGWTVTVTGGY